MVAAIAVAAGPTGDAARAGCPVNTDPATDVSTSSATLNGTIYCVDGSVDYEFGYGTTSHPGAADPSVYDQSVSGTASGSNVASASSSVSELLPGTTYYFTLFANRQNGGELSFTTDSDCTNTVTTGPARDVTATSARLTGSVENPCPAEGYAYHFQYATNEYWTTNEGYSDSTPVADSQSPNFSQNVSSLLPDTLYHYRLVVDSLEQAGEDRTFATPEANEPPPPPPPPPPTYDPNADLSVVVTTQSGSASRSTKLLRVGRATAGIGDTLTYVALVKNWGPRMATAVSLTDVLPAQVSLTSVSPSQGSCSGTTTVTCSLGALGFGSSATVQMVTKVIAAGSAINNASVSNPDQPDPNTSNQTSVATTGIANIASTSRAAGPPQYGTTFNLRPISGIVLVRLPGTTDFVSITDVQTVPEGTEVDATKGSVELTSASDPANDTQTAIFYFGRFVISYEPPEIGTAPTPPGTTTNLVTQLLLSAPLDCPAAVKATSKKSKKQRHTTATKDRGLWGTGKGSFRTRGKFAAATVRGTYWFTQDTCTTTFEKTRVGVVDVYDFVLGKHFFVPAGQSHTAQKK